MEERTFETVIKVMAEKIELLEWQLKNAEENNRKLKAENKALADRLIKLEGETENA